MEHDRFANSKNYSNDQVPSRIVKVSFPRRCYCSLALSGDIFGKNKNYFDSLLFEGKNKKRHEQVKNDEGDFLRFK
jgi:hypothetical protein